MDTLGGSFVARKRIQQTFLSPVCSLGTHLFPSQSLITLAPNFSHLGSYFFCEHHMHMNILDLFSSINLSIVS